MANNVPSLIPAGNLMQHQPAEVAPDGRSTWEIYRRSGLLAERTLGRIGFVYYLGGIGAIGFGLSSVAVNGGFVAAFSIFAGFLLAVFLLVVGYGFRSVVPWVRVPGIILGSLISLLIPLGTAIGVYSIWLLAGKYGELLFSPKYQAARRHLDGMAYRAGLSDDFRP